MAQHELNKEETVNLFEDRLFAFIRKRDVDMRILLLTEMYELYDSRAKEWSNEGETQCN